jgi:hypothetical protein
MIIPTVAFLLFITLLIFICFEGQKEEKEKKRLSLKISKDYAASMMAINKELFNFEEECRELERKERQILDLRIEAMTRQKRRAAHKRKGK